MVLNDEIRYEVRNYILEQLKNVSEGQRIKLDKELLDDLIFFKGKNKDGRIIKVPVWTGQFLRKIDLSELSFENVLFQIGYGDKIEEVMNAEDVSIFINMGDDIFPEYYAPFVDDNSLIDFSYTNANIDFSKIYGKRIECCNFEGLDLSKSNVECLDSIYCCNFAYTNIKFPRFETKRRKYIYIK